MTQRQRSLLFAFLAFLFMITSLVVIFYSQGYRFNFREKQITQSGAFYLKVIPKNVQVQINNQPRKKTDILFGAVFIDNLLPKTYNVKVKKEGYYSWEKNLAIKEKQVTEVKNIILFPLNPSFSVLSKETSDFFLSQDEQKILTLETAKGGWELKLYDLKNSIKTHLLGVQDLSKGKIEISNIYFSPDVKRILLKTFSGKEMRYFIFDLGQKTGTLQSLTQLDFLGKNIKEVIFSPQNTQEVFFWKEGKIGKADFLTKKISPNFLNDVLAFTLNNNVIYYLEKEGLLYRTDFSFTQKEKLNLANVEIKEKAEYEIIIMNDFLFLKENESLYLLNHSSGAFEIFFEKNKGLKISPDFRKAVYWSDSEIWVLFLKDQEEQPQKKGGEKLFLTRFSEKIGEVFWLNPYYLIFNNGGQIKIAEIDERDKINIIDLIEFEGSRFFFNKSNKKLYLLDQGGLSFSEALM